MGSINLSNLLMNIHTSSTANKTANGTKKASDASNAGGFNEALDKAKQGGNSKNINKKTASAGQDKMTVKKASKSNKASSISLEDEDTSKEEAEKAILDILSMQLQVPAKEMTGILEEVGLSPMELMEEDKFSQFITAFYGETSAEDLLMGQTDIKEISKLFSKIEEVSSKLADDASYTMKADVSTAEFTETQISSMENAILLDNQEIGEVEETVNSIWKPKEEKQQSGEKTAGQSIQMAQTMPIEQLGISIPIEAFESAVSLRNDEVQTSQNINGIHVKPELNLAAQIVDHIEVTRLEQMQEIKMQLSPKELGQLAIKLVEKNGVLVAEIKVESEKTKDFILSEIDTLKQSLGEQGIDISNVQVDVRQNDNTTQMQQQKQKSSKRIQEIIAKHLQELEEEEAELNEERKLDAGESEIDYMI